MLHKEETSLGSVMGSPTDPHGGYFIGPLSPIKKRELNKRLLFPKKGMKSKVVEPPQGYLKEGEELKSPEYLYTKEGKKVTQADLNEWFKPYGERKPAWNHGKIVQIEPKCETFPYCSQGAVDNPIKLVGENKDAMCEECYEYIKEIAKIAKKTPEYITEIIRKEYLSYKYD